MNHDAAEHASGLRPPGEYPDHCDECQRLTQLYGRQNTCVHNLVELDFGTLDGHSWRRVYCDRCALVFPVGTEVAR